MTRLFNDPAAFADEMAEGFAAASARWVLPVAGGVIRSTRSERATVVVVIGGGSGHYPAFGGLVGQGLAHGAALGGVFASPSAEQVYTVAKSVEMGAGVLLTYGNYAGDVLHFDRAQERLVAEGIPCRTVVVTDDISSAPAEEMTTRRGVAGGVAVFKSAGAAAEAELPLDEVTRVARRANAMTRSIGVAFGGCTLPGADHPLFSVPSGRMAVGMGVHGEPGIGDGDVPTADGLAELLVTSLLVETPDDADTVARGRVGVILNGLGSVKYEELFVVYRRIAQLLGDEGLEIVDPEVGELVTSLDMAGVSLTLFWLDDELETYWCAPADTPGFRKGSVSLAARRDAAPDPERLAGPVPTASSASRSAAKVVWKALTAAKAILDEEADELGRIDAIAGDGDHGIGMQRGATAALAAATAARVQGAGAGTVLLLAGAAWEHRAGGASGALWGAGLQAAAAELGDAKALEPETVGAAVAAALAAVTRVGGAQVGDRTMVDVLHPFSAALTDEIAAGSELTTAWTRAARIAQKAARSTATLVPRVGRARLHAKRSIGTPDAGAVSLSLVIDAVGRVASHPDHEVRMDREVAP